MFHHSPLPEPEFPLEPIDGMVQPPVVADPQKSRRNTNQLQYLVGVAKALWKHKNAGPFRSPVNTIKLNIPDYYNVVRHPMDLGTIRKRLDNCYYYSASECSQDFNTMFSNCYFYNTAESDVVYMAQTLEKVYALKMQDMPEDEIEIPFSSTKRKRRKGKTAKGNKSQLNDSWIVNFCIIINNIQINTCILY